MIDRNRAAWTATGLTFLFTGLLALHASHYFPFISDDALISFRYAARLLHGDGLSWTDGRPVEGYSNLLWILLVSFLGIFRVDLIIAARILGLLATAVMMFSVSYWCARNQSLRAGWFPITVALGFLALGAPIAVWSIGGLEQPLFGALIAVSILLTYLVIESCGTERSTILSLSLVEGLICITRPDGPIFSIAAAVSLVLGGWLQKRPGAARNALLVLLGPVLFSLGQLAFRLSYYEELLPNTALVKFAPSPAHSAAGLAYLSDGLNALSPFSILAAVCLLGLCVSSRTRARAVCLLIPAVAWSAYVVVIGGDVFPAYRHFVPLMVILAFALVEALAIAMPRLLPRRARLYAMMALVFVLFIPYGDRQFNNKHNQRAVRERWEWQGKEVALLLKAAFSEQQPLLAVTAAGCLPYWSELPSLDMLGLNDYYLPRHRPKDFGSGWVGHELGDGRYVLSRRPDIIIFNVGSGPAYRSGEEIDRMPEFHDRYTPVVVRTVTGGYDAIVYVDKYSRKIGIRATGQRVTIPGFLFGGDGTTAHLNGRNKLVVSVVAGRAARVAFDSDPSHVWALDAKPSDRVTAEFRQEGKQLTVTVRSPPHETAEIEDVVLRRLANADEAVAIASDPRTAGRRR